MFVRYIPLVDRLQQSLGFYVLIGHQTTLETGCISLPLVQEFIDIVFIEHLEIFLAFVYLYIALVFCCASLGLVVDCWLPVLEEMSCHLHIVVLFCGGLAHRSLELGSLNQPSCVPLRHPGHPVERPQLEMSIDVSNIDLRLSRLLLGINSPRLTDRVRLLKPIAYVMRVIPILTLGL